MKLTRILQSAMALTATAIIAVSCQKNSETPASGSLQLPNQLAAVTSIVSTDTIYGNWGFPFNPSTYGTVKVQLGGTDSIALTSYNNSFVQKIGNYQLYYLETSTAFASLTTSNFTTSGTAASSIGLSSTTTSPFTGWYTYDQNNPGGPQLVPDFYIAAVSTAPGGTNYALYFTYVGGEGTGSPNRGKYIIRKGILN